MPTLRSFVLIATLCFGAPVAAQSVFANPREDPPPVTPTDRGGTITTGGTAQNAMSANGLRKSGWIQNPCTATEDLFVSTSTTATITGVGDDADLAPCGSFSLSPGLTTIQSAVSVIGSTTGHRFIAKEAQ